VIHNLSSYTITIKLSSGVRRPTGHFTDDLPSQSVNRPVQNTQRSEPNAWLILTKYYNKK